MKNMILVMALTLVAFTTAQAQQVCGKLTKEKKGADCAQGQPCPQFVEEQYVLETSTEKMELGAPSMKIFNELQQDEGQDVCVTGTINTSSGEMMVRKVSLQK